MKVITVLNSDFDNLCFQLADKVSSEYSPDLIVGVATGGEFVAKKIAERLNVPTLIIKRQRNATKYKSKFKISKLLPLLPRVVNDKLRIVEIKYNEWMFNKKGRIISPGNVIFKEGDVEQLARSKKIILVDDSVDSGGTFVDCLKFLNNHCEQGTTIKTAALNVTFSDPVVKPDFCMYEEILLRCPWANDVVAAK
ncbi:phosphoribosyltransferase [Serratia rubidaea]|uniref:Phosphoribosyltransferase n=1 Tax=Serratia rubidaea TaxID=61652 RepID=A0A3S4X758_SERRU|nr:phosphoribosyltransferase [Serratia rubidaea]MBH1928443.1 phosphoribosyltransferase [Serratia rubidaea]MDC6119878.1 phosphoribosyltransferase [Serratia rubidaea]MEB7584246.1 phosphoribosyltransferase [Serratia rubidaea]VEI72552.1 ribose-phosphate diphosphokinase [Serratia rubidaea]